MTPDPDDARFQELMAREFPEGLVPRLRRRSSSEADQPPSPPTTQDTEDDGFRRWTPADEPEEPFTPPPAPPARPWSAGGILGTALLSLTAVVGLAGAFGLQPPAWVSALAAVACVTGVGLLLIRLRRRPPTDGDGAVV